MTLDAKWTKTVDDGISNKKWDEYDETIKSEVDDYNRRFSLKLDWKIFKALLWVESGGPSSSAWTTRPMQIGNKGDPGYAVVRDGKEAAGLIMSDKLKVDIKGDINKPELNIRAGIAYALTRLVKSEMQSVDDPKDTTVYEYTVAPGDSFDRIAKNVGSTVASMQKQNPTVKMLQPKQKVKYRKASIQRVITGWMTVDTANLASRYNVGDASYKEKLDYVLDLFTKLKR
jgi:hypothetical protein